MTCLPMNSRNWMSCVLLNVVVQPALIIHRQPMNPDFQFLRLRKRTFWSYWRIVLSQQNMGNGTLVYQSLSQCVTTFQSRLPMRLNQSKSLTDESITMNNHCTATQCCVTQCHAPFVGLPHCWHTDITYFFQRKMSWHNWSDFEYNHRFFVSTII